MSKIEGIKTFFIKKCAPKLLLFKKKKIKKENRRVKNWSCIWKKKVSKIEGIKTFLSKNAPLNYYCLKKQTKKTLSGQLGSILNSFTNI